jgi:hypothetical protein
MTMELTIYQNRRAGKPRTDSILCPDLVILGFLVADFAFVVFVLVLGGVVTSLLTSAICVVHPFYLCQFCSATNRNTGSYEEVRKHVPTKMKSKFLSGEDR